MKTKARRKPPSRREQARRASQSANSRRMAVRAAVGRTRSRGSFSDYAKSLLDTDDPAEARRKFAANPELFAQLASEYDGIPVNQHGLREAVFVHSGHDSDHFEFCDSAVNIESWYKQDHRRDDIDDALVNGWCAMQETAAGGLRQSRLDNNVRDMGDFALGASGGRLTKTADQWLTDLMDWCGVSQNMASDLQV